MSDEAFSRRWLLLSVIGMLTSFLLTIGVAAFGFRGVASADNRQARPAASADARPTSGTLLIREIGGSPIRTPTATLGTAPTIRETEQPSWIAQRFIQDPGGLPPPNAEPTPAPEPTEPPPPLPPAPLSNRSAPALDPPARAAGPSSAPNNPMASRAPEPPPVIQPAATSTPVPRVTAAASPGVYEAIADSAPARATSTAAVTATKAPATATTRTAQDESPTVSVQLSDSRIESGDSITVTVYARDDRGLDWIAWEGRDSGERALDRENRYDCDGRTTCVQSWTVRVSRTGTHTIQGQARDSKGQKSDDVVELRVRSVAAATATRTPVPVITSIPTR